MNVPKNLKYTKEHEWIRPFPSRGVVGITEYAAKELGDITFIELPPIEKVLQPSEVICSIESVKAASDIYAPVSGKITKINQALEDTPEKINSSPYEDGWICEIENCPEDDFEALMNADDYEHYLDGLKK